MQRLFRQFLNLAVGGALVAVIFLAARAWAQETPAASTIPAAGSVTNASINVVNNPDSPDAPARLIQYQGMLLTPQGVPQPSGSYSMIFRLYQDNNTVVYQQQTNVVVNEGFFSVDLGPVDPALFTQQQFMGVQVANDPEMTPRQPFRYVPYAMYAERAKAVDGSQNVLRSYGVVNADGSKRSGVQFSSQRINNFDGGTAYAIDIGETYTIDGYVTTVTPQYTNANGCNLAQTAVTSASNGQLIVILFNTNGQRLSCTFQFAVIDLP